MMWIADSDHIIILFKFDNDFIFNTRGIKHALKPDTVILSQDSTLSK